jgi:MSHA pilin protein MshA
MRKPKQQGFTLVELVVVIVVLGILAAIAIPRYASYISEARTAAIQGVAGAARSAVALVQARWAVTGSNSNNVVMQDQTNVAVTAATGIPTSAATGIGNAVNLGGTGATFVYDATNSRFDLPTAVTNCNAGYNATTGAVTVTTTGC